MCTFVEALLGGESIPSAGWLMTENHDPALPSIGDSRTRKTTGDLISILSRKVVGQSSAISAIVPYVHMYQSGLAPEGRPAGVFLLIGPTGTGKTKKKIVQIDCGEFQMEHEMAKLLGAPLGYLGHLETVPMLTQQQLTNATSEQSELPLVLSERD